MRLETLLQRLETEQASLAHDALRQPSGREPFDYGMAVGMYAGLERAKQVLVDMVAEKERRDFNI